MYLTSNVSLSLTMRRRTLSSKPLPLWFFLCPTPLLASKLKQTFQQ